MMNSIFRVYFVFVFVLLILALCFGEISSFIFLYPERYNNVFNFQQAHPFHISSALFWIISGATACILYFSPEEFDDTKTLKNASNAFMLVWMVSIVAIFIFYAFGKFGGREYWEFPPVLNIPVLISWLVLMIAYFIPWFRSQKQKPVYIWMWSTGMLFFLFTFIEQNLWHIAWFRESIIREITIQWKSNGSMVGAWNQMIYGLSLYLMVKITGDASIAKTRTAYFFYFLGLINLIFNWGHHIYNLPANSGIRTVSYAISMTEWIIFINIMQTFRHKLQERERFKHLVTYRFLINAEFWVAANLLLALLMSMPFINRYTHGTHVTVAHAMGTTIGINSMILLASFSYLLNIDEGSATIKTVVKLGFWVGQVSLVAFWICLIVAGIIKGYRSNHLQIATHAELMQPVLPLLKFFAYAGIGVLVGIGTIAIVFARLAWRFNNSNR
jgi:nitric oxide reductase subunit B